MAAATPRRPKLLIAGHSFHFCEQIAQRARSGGAAVKEDRWQRHGGGDRSASAAALAWADVVFCEWCLGNAVWYSRNKRQGQRLVVRFHRMELETTFPGELDLERVDAMVFVAEHVFEQACERYGWNAEDPRFQIIPNELDLAALAQDKLPGSRFTLGTIGYLPRLKRLDRALDILDLLRLHDDRYHLLVKGRGPWEVEWMSSRNNERRFYEALFRRVERAPNLRQAVEFKPFGYDVPDFLRQVGWILSTSEVEGHPVAVAEGMASGAIPVILDRPGASEQYESRWVHPDASAAAERILAIQERTETTAEGDAARRFVERWSLESLGSTWDRLLEPTSRSD